MATVMEIELDDFEATEVEEFQDGPLEPAGPESSDDDVIDSAATPQKTPREIAIEDFKQEIADASAELTAAVLARIEAEATYKAAKAAEKEAGLALARLNKRGPIERPTPTTVQPEAESGSQSMLDSKPENEAWKSASVTDLEACGLKPHVTKKLVEAGIETIGQLEDRRAEISNGRAKWPAGIGQAKITQIEDAIVAWLTKNRDAAVFSQAENSPQKNIQPKIPIEETENKSPIDRAEELNTGQEDCLDQRITDGQGSGCWDSGYEANGRGVDLNECPYIPGPEQDDWIRGWLAADRGWLAAELLNQYEEGDERVKPPDKASDSLVADLMDL